MTPYHLINNRYDSNTENERLNIDKHNKNDKYNNIKYNNINRQDKNINNNNNNYDTNIDILNNLIERLESRHNRISKKLIIFNRNKKIKTIK